MVRLKQGQSSVPTKQQSADIELMEDLVRASLKINPNLRGEKSTAEVMQDLQHGASKAPTGVAAGPAKSPAQDPRQSNLAFFFENKTKQLHDATAEFGKRRQAITDEEQTLHAKMCRELIDFLALAASSPAEAKTTLERYPQLLKELGTRTDALLRQLAERKA